MKPGVSHSTQPESKKKREVYRIQKGKYSKAKSRWDGLSYKKLTRNKLRPGIHEKECLSVVILELNGRHLKEQRVSKKNQLQKTLCKMMGL